MNQEYKKPVLEIIVFDTEDVITTSGEEISGGDED